MNNKEDKIYEQVLEMLDQGKSHGKILASFGDGHDEVKEIFETIDMVGKEEIKPDKTLLQSVIDKVNSGAVTNSGDVRLNIIENVHDKKQNYFIYSLIRMFSMKKSFLFAGGGVIVILLVVGLLSFLNYNQNNNTMAISLPELEQTLALETEPMEQDFEELDSFLVDDLNIDEDLLVLANFGDGVTADNNLSLSSAATNVEGLDDDVGAELNSLLQDLEELDGLDDGYVSDIDTEISELFS
ncbi:MAG: hypothetical protein COX81_02860 [Candidatus Magasanikbacteria bacterium CG_4_10_14_0_2_um_filter_37_12]|uniref:Uncharacterized protein n=1 Tax=Candidatus Magasanikbacteria bacterium CG_4_10_14_0_2_um_filter_37_12 TaxID=1974637 RepID=A0A2M7V7K6_9BACT|nr:MAG: hypothetical protein COX81_02860 [Candidatus Magasanikbacteria bacterium CG_4_10_14_0_2_um_filter_37_12]